MTQPPRPQVFDWDDLRIFHALVSAGSMSAAARRLGIGQPTVSRRLEQLEGRIGARLVTRGADGVELTDVGELIWTQVQIMQSTAGDIERIAHQADRADAGTVRLAAPDGVTGFWIAQHLPSFVEANPLINLEIITRVDGEAAPEGADVILQMVESKRMAYVANELATLHYVPFASRRYLDTYGPPTGLADVLNHRIGDLVSYRQQQSHWPKEASAIKQMMNPSLTTDSSLVITEAVHSGAVIAMMPTYAAKTVPGLVHVDMGLVVPITLWIVYHPDQRRVTRVRKVLDWLRDVFDSAAYPWFRRDFVSPAEFGDVETVTVRGERPRPRPVG
ncbi:MAG: LysR family transcriptional regulator [Oceanicaulis sp.]